MQKSMPTSERFNWASEASNSPQNLLPFQVFMTTTVWIILSYIIYAIIRQRQWTEYCLFTEQQDKQSKLTYSLG
jgi:hypothetical protein